MTRAPIKLSREMKLLLGLLLLVAAIGLWYVLTNRSGTPDAGTPATTPSAGAGDTVPVTPPTQTDSAGSGAATGTGVQSGGPVDVEVIPPFPTSEPAAEPTVTDTPPTPAGINPAGTLASVPGNNPFRPLSVEGGAQTATPAQSNGTISSNSGASTPVTSAPTATVTPIPSGGTLGLNPISGTGSSSSGALPIPTIPSPSGSSEPVTVTPITSDGTVSALPTGTSGVNPGTVSTGSEPVTTITPVKPPVAGVNVPSVTRLPGLTANAGTTGNAQTGTGAAGAGTAGSLPTSAPQPGTPQVISEIGAGTSAATAPSALETFVQTQQLAFNAVVLGPVNTAIFRSKDGYVVVAVGQTLPDSQVTVKDVTATGATLSLGNDSKTLELDKR